MIRGFFRLIFQIVILVILIVIGTAVWVVYDGSKDQGTEADCALVSGRSLESDGTPGPVLKDRLDLAARLVRDQKVQFIIVSGKSHPGNQDEATGMTRYLRVNGIPNQDIVQDHQGNDIGSTARNVAAILKAHSFHSVMVVGSYYQITRTKLALNHEGVTALTQAHVGAASVNDLSDVARETVEIYNYLYTTYLKSTTDKVTVQARTLTEQLTKKIDSAKEKTKDLPPEKTSDTPPPAK